VIIAGIFIIDILVPIIFFTLVTSITILLFIRRKQSGVNALDWPIAIFFTVSLMGFFEIIKTFFPNLIIFASGDKSTAFDIIRIFHLIALILLYVMAETFLNDRLNLLRLSILTSLIATYFFLGVYYLSTGLTILTRDIIGFGVNHANYTSYLEALVFDIFQVIVVGLLLFVYLKQYKFASETVFKKYILAFIFAIIFFFLSSLYEICEHFFLIPNLSAFLTAIPTFILLAAIYFKYPNLIFLAPCNISALQLINTDGVVLYVAQLLDNSSISETHEFLLGPGLISINTMIEEILQEEAIEIKKIVFNTHTIVFQRIGDLRAILITNRSAQILKRAMRHFLREFRKEFADQIDNYKGYVMANEKGITPEDLFRKCIPIVESEEIISSFPQNK
jgi:hypothetical protein